MAITNRSHFSKIFAIAVFAMLMSSVSVRAQERGDRHRFMSEIRNYKHDFISKELDLTNEQRDVFFPIYDKMDDEIRKLNDETRDIERKTIDNADATDVEIEAAAQAVFAQKAKEAQIETTYFEQFKNILDNRQLLRLKNVERRFTQELVKHQHRIRKGRKAEGRL